jgi:hypothetical protein
MTGIPRELAKHALKILPGAKPVRQAMRRFRDEKWWAIAKELSKLLKSRLCQRSDSYMKELCPRGK